MNALVEAQKKRIVQMLLKGKIYGLPGSDGTVRMLVGVTSEAVLGLRPYNGGMSRFCFSQEDICWPCIQNDQAITHRCHERLLGVP